MKFSEKIVELEEKFEVVIVLNNEVEIVFRWLDELVVFIEDLIVVIYDNVKVLEYRENYEVRLVLECFFYMMLW